MLKANKNPTAKVSNRMIDKSLFFLNSPIKLIVKPAIMGDRIRFIIFKNELFKKGYENISMLIMPIEIPKIK